MYINVKVITNAKTAQITELKPLYYKAKVKSVPEKGKANIELINMLAKHFDCRKSDIRIISGHRSPEKLISIPHQIEKNYKE